MNSTVYNRNNKIFLIVIAVILLIPAVLAANFALRADKESVASHRIQAIDILAASGTSVRLTEKNDFDLYVSAIESARLIDDKFRDLSAETPFTVTFTESDDISREYRFYMVNGSDGCIFTDPDGKYYLLSEADAVKLLERNEFASVNGFAVVPYAAITKGEETVTLAPSGGTWNYRGADGKYVAQEITASGEPKTLKIGVTSLGDLSFYSDVPPARVTATLSRNGVVVHDGDYANMLNANVMSSTDTYYDLVIRAEWTRGEEESENVNYFGEAVYTARVLYDVAPTYTVIYNGAVSKGDFTVIRIQNFNEGDKLFASCAYPVPSELQVFHSGLGYDFAFLPAEFTSVAAGRYDLTLSLEDGSSQTVAITVRDGRNPATYTQDLLVSDTNLQSAFTAEAFEELEKAIADATASTSPTLLWDGKFVYPDAANKGTVGTGMAHFGTNRTVRALHQESYIHTGIDIAMTAGENVLAANNGTVVFAGPLTLTGNTVIIDHGCSVFTYYYHLNSLNVAVGDSVSKSGVIGTAGQTGFAAAQDGAVCKQATQVQFSASVEGVFVNPYYLWKSGVVFGNN